MSAGEKLLSSLPSREPLAQKKSIGARSSVLNQARSSFLGRFTGGKSLGGQQGVAQPNEDEGDAMEVDVHPRPLLGREESETTKNHNHSTTQELRNRINMLNQTRDMRTSKSIPNLNASTAQPLYPQLGQTQLDKSEDESVRPTTAPLCSGSLIVLASFSLSLCSACLFAFEQRGRRLVTGDRERYKI